MGHTTDEALVRESRRGSWMRAHALDRAGLMRHADLVRAGHGMRMSRGEDLLAAGDIPGLDVETELGALLPRGRERIAGATS